MQGAFAEIPGVVIDHLTASGGIYIGSPSIAILPNGNLIASHDEFGPKSNAQKCARTSVFRSMDRGIKWAKLSVIDGQFWSTLFLHRGALYLLGTDKEHGSAVIRRSLDGGMTWTVPADSKSGLLRGDAQYHCAPTPVIEHAGRLWRGFEQRNPPKGWGITYCAGMFSAPAAGDLLDADRWAVTNFLVGDKTWLGGAFGGWLEGNAVVTRNGELLDILRVDTGCPEKAALVRVDCDHFAVSFNAESGFIEFPGGAKKFTIRYDSQSRLYWSLNSIIPEPYRPKLAAQVRNTLALTCSSDLIHWNLCKVLLQHADVKKHGYQYVDWQFDGEDIIAVCRTADDDSFGGAANFHDSNYLTFHRITGFRRLSP